MDKDSQGLKSMQPQAEATRADVRKAIIGIGVALMVTFAGQAIAAWYNVQALGEASKVQAAISAKQSDQIAELKVQTAELQVQSKTQSERLHLIETKVFR